MYILKVAMVKLDQVKELCKGDIFEKVPLLGYLVKHI